MSLPLVLMTFFLFSCGKEPGALLIQGSNSRYTAHEAQEMRNAWLLDTSSTSVEDEPQIPFSDLKIRVRGDGDVLDPGFLVLENYTPDRFEAVSILINGEFVYRLKGIDSGKFVEVPLRGFIDWRGNRFEYSKSEIADFRLICNLGYMEGTFVGFEPRELLNRDISENYPE